MIWQSQLLRYNIFGSLAGFRMGVIPSCGAGCLFHLQLLCSSQTSLFSETKEESEVVHSSQKSNHVPWTGSPGSCQCKTDFITALCGGRLEGDFSMCYVIFTQFILTMLLLSELIFVSICSIRHFNFKILLLEHFKLFYTNFDINSQHSFFNITKPINRTYVWI